jgi:16S rRNA (adenine1518-N6/adenine1519-N6)-dimethyltransferase
MEHRPRKRFGQNFLHDRRVIERILEALDARPDQHLVEIGPGQGAITAGLLASARSVDLIELDRDLVQPLIDRFDLAVGGEQMTTAPEGHRCRIYNADALSFDLCSLLPAATPGAGEASSSSRSGGDTGHRRLRIVGNLPYNISTPLLFRFLEQSVCIEDAHLMLQKEVVDRITAGPGSKVFGRLSVMVQTYCSAERLFTVAPGAFHPAPKVSSAVIRVIPLRTLPVRISDRDWHARLVAAAFSQRRKTLRNCLSGLISADRITELGIDPAARAETLSVADFVTLANGSSACNDSTRP